MYRVRIITKSSVGIFNKYFKTKTSAKAYAKRIRKIRKVVSSAKVYK